MAEAKATQKYVLFQQKEAQVESDTPPGIFTTNQSKPGDQVCRDTQFKDQTQSPFFRVLPPEIRNQIYSYVLAAGKVYLQGEVSSQSLLRKLVKKKNETGSVSTSNCITQVPGRL